MGTRSTYRVIERDSDDNEKVIVCLYAQYDGYPQGHPLETAQWLEKVIMVNGFGELKKDEIVANGAGCLAAQLVNLHKTGTGGYYIISAEDYQNQGEDYTYNIIVNHVGQIKIKAYHYEDNWQEIFTGTVTEFVKFCSEQ